MKNENKIRKYLGDRYHLHVTLGGENLEVESWKLFRKYPGYLTDGSTAIMTSETHSEEDLYKFAKKHKYYKTERIITKLFVLVAYIGMILGIISSTLDNNDLYCFYFGIEFVIFFVGLSMIPFYMHNLNVDQLECKEMFKELEEMCEQDE